MAVVRVQVPPPTPPRGPGLSGRFSPLTCTSAPVDASVNRVVDALRCLPVCLVAASKRQLSARAPPSAHSSRSEYERFEQWETAMASKVTTDTVEPNIQRRTSIATGKSRYAAYYRDPAGRRRTKTFAQLEHARRFLITVRAHVQDDVWLDPGRSRTTLNGTVSLVVRLTRPLAG